MKYNNLIIIFSATIVSACVAPERKVNYVSPLEFQAYSCNQISKEMSYVSGQLDVANQQNTTNKMLDASLHAFAISQNHAYINGDLENSEKIERLKSKYEALNKVAIQKNCI